MEDCYLSTNLRLGECVKSDTALRAGINNWPTDPAVVTNLTAVARNVWQRVRNHYGVPMTVSSGYRSPALNAFVKGKRNSQHCAGEALDFEVPGVANYDVACWIRDNCTFDQLILEFYTPGKPNSGWIHVSYKNGHNRKECLTFDGKTFRTGLLQ